MDAYNSLILGDRKFLITKRTECTAAASETCFWRGVYTYSFSALIFIHPPESP